MLIDTLLLPTNKLVMANCQLGASATALRHAQKFVLSSDFAFAADGLIDNVPELRKIYKFCRLPYPITWIEVAQAERPHFREGPMFDMTVRPPRVGYLCVAKPDELNTYIIQLYWSIPNTHNEFSTSTYAVQVDTEGSFPFPEIKLELTKFGALILATHGGRFTSKKSFAEFYSSDWNGEFPFLIAALGLMNTRNVTAFQAVDHTEWNTKRLRRGQHPLASHHIVNISHTMRKQIARTGDSTESPRGVRFHFVRGHFKVRATGIFWWNNFARGNPALGGTTHDYKIGV